MIKEIEIGSVDPNPFVRREDMGDIDALAASMREHGQIEAIKVRPHPSKQGRYQTADGERRTLAGKKLEWKKIRADVGELSAVEMIVASAIPCVHRKQHNHVEEAAHYAALVEQGLTIPQIASQCAVLQARVVKRLSLQALVAQVRTALSEGRIALGVAELIARVPLHKQPDALAMVAGDDFRAALPVDRARELIVGRYTRKLAAAPFNPDDETLHPEAGRCAPCPKRTGQQPMLFDVEDKDLCTDHECFKTKTEAAWKQQIAKAKKDGQGVIDDPKKLKKIFPFDGSSVTAVEYVALDGWADTHRELRWREVIKDKQVPVWLALSPTGPLEVAWREDCQPHLLAAQGRAKEAEEATQQTKEKQAAAAGKRELDRRVALQCMGYHVADIEANGLREVHWRHLARRLLAHNPEAAAEIVKRRDCARDGFQPIDALGTYIEQQPVKVVQGIAFELLDSGMGFYSIAPARNAALKAICELADLDLDKVREEVKGAMKAEEAKEAVKPKRGRKKAA